MKKLIALTLCAVMSLSFAACTNHSTPKDDSSKQSIGKDIEIPNPWVDCATIADAEKLAGFAVILPKTIPDGYTQKSIAATKDGMIQIIYENGENQITFRQSKGNDDISGIHTEYKENNPLTIGSLKVTAKGNGGKVNVATWVNGEYSFAILANPDGKGLENQTINDMIRSMDTAADSLAVQPASPFIPFKTLAEAEKLAGFSVTLPEEIPEGYTQKAIEAIENQMLQILFEKGENGIVIRKAKGSEDISGDYNKYSENKTLTVGGLHVLAKGNNGKVNVATWTNGEYTYAVTVGSGETGFDAAVMSDMISSIR